MEYDNLFRNLKEKIGGDLSRQDTSGLSEDLKMLKKLYSEMADRQEKESIGNEIAIALCGLTELYQDSLNIFETLICLNDCRDLVNDFPRSAHYAGSLLRVMGALLYLKIQMREDGMVGEYTDEILEITDRFPENEEITMTACACLANLIPLCGSFDAPLSMAYHIADEMAPIAQRFGGSPRILEAYCHVLVSVCAFARRTDNGKAYNRYARDLYRICKDKADVLGTDGIRNVQEHMSQNGVC